MKRAKTLTIMRALREQAGMSQAQLADAIGVSQGKISTWESGLVPIPAKRERQIADLLGLADPRRLGTQYELKIQ